LSLVEEIDDESYLSGLESEQQESYLSDQSSNQLLAEGLESEQQETQQLPSLSQTSEMTLAEEEATMKTILSMQKVSRE